MSDRVRPPPLPANPRARDDLVFRELADEWVLFDPGGKRLHVMNLTAALVWSHCDGARTVAEIVDAVREAFPDPPDPRVAAEDVRRALEAFEAKGLLREGRPNDEPAEGRPEDSSDEPAEDRPEDSSDDRAEDQAESRSEGPVEDPAEDRAEGPSTGPAASSP